VQKGVEVKDIAHCSSECVWCEGYKIAHAIQAGPPPGAHDHSPVGLNTTQGTMEQMPNDNLTHTVSKHKTSHALMHPHYWSMCDTTGPVRCTTGPVHYLPVILCQQAIGTSVDTRTAWL